MTERIDRWRERIDEVDTELVRLLNKRTQYAIEIGKIKQELQIAVYDPEREEKVVENVLRASRQESGFLTRQGVRRIFERIIDETRRAEREHRHQLDESL